MATAFNFNDWITKNKLDAISHLFIKYDMTTIETLSLQSKSFQKFICDPLLITTHHKLMATSIAAMQKLGHDTFDESSFIVISEEENAVIGRIKSDLSKLRGMPNELNDLKIKYLQSIEKIRNDKLKQIVKAQHKVNQTFQNVITALNQKKQLILNQLQEMKNDVNQHEPMDALVSISSLQKVIAKLCDDLEECKAKIKSQTEIRNRQEDVLSIGQRAKETFEEISNEMNQNRDRVKRMIERNNGIRSGIDFVVNHRVYNRLVSPQNIGVIIDCNRDQKEEGHVIKPEVIDHQHLVPSETGSSNEERSDVDISSNQEQSVSFEPEQNTNSHMDLSNDPAIISDDDSERTEDIDHQDVNTQSTEDDMQMNENISEGSRYYCKECDQHFKTQLNRTRHIERIHERKINHKCKECNAKFYMKYDYTRHVERVHEHKKKYTCRECNAKFYEKHERTRHIERVHEGKTNYECNKCQKRFYAKVKRIMNATSVKKDFTQNTTTKCILKKRINTKQIMNPHDIPSQRMEANANINVRNAMHHFIQKIVWQSILNKHIMKKRSNTIVDIVRWYFQGRKI
eukprot:711708_1